MIRNPLPRCAAKRARKAVCRRLWRALLAFVVLWQARSAGLAQVVVDPAPRYTFRADHDPNGIGKFYMGREIAQVMGHQGASWLERPTREAEEASARLIELLPVQPGAVIADVGAGSGYLTFPLARRVGPKGRVYAVDIQPEMLERIRARMTRERVHQIEPVRGTATDPKLPPAAVDLILMVDVYHEFSEPWEMTNAMIAALKPGGKLVFVEYRLEDPLVPIKLVHKMTEKQVLREMAAFPLRWAATLDPLPWQHVIIFERP